MAFELCGDRTSHGVSERSQSVFSVFYHVDWEAGSTNPYVRRYRRYSRCVYGFLALASRRVEHRQETLIASLSSWTYKSYLNPAMKYERGHSIRCDSTSPQSQSSDDVARRCRLRCSMHNRMPLPHFTSPHHLRTITRIVTNEDGTAGRYELNPSLRDLLTAIYLARQAEEHLL